MKLSHKLVLSFLAILLFFVGISLNWINGEIRKTYSALIEESLISEANFIASYLSGDEELSTRVENFVSGLEQRDSSTIDFYITDVNGKVIFHSTDNLKVEQDYSKWNDVYLTLRGSYGARSTRTIKSDPLSSIFYIAAPIMQGRRIVGVVSVFRPEMSLNHILQRSKTRVIILLGFVLLVGILVSIISFNAISRPFENLKLFINQIVNSRSAQLPRLPKGEFRDLGVAIQNMKTSLDEKNKIEGYVQNLIHELKSPLTAIRASAEILEDESDSEDQKNFAKNIEQQSNRIKDMLNTLLEISRLQNMQRLESLEEVDLRKVLDEIVEDMSSSFEQREDELTISGQGSIEGNHYFLRQAIRNLLQNIVVHAPVKSEVSLKITETGGLIILQIKNTGSNLPDFVLEKMFDRYFSFAHSSHARGSGLGLSLVKEVVDLHGGEVDIDNIDNALIFSLVFSAKTKT